MLFRIIQPLPTTKISSPEIYEGYLSNRQKYIPEKYQKKLSLEIIFLGQNFIRSLNFLFQINFLKALASLKKLF